MTRLDISIRPLLFDTPSATIPRSGIPTAVISIPINAGIKLAPALAPSIIGKIRLPAPKNIPKSIDATSAYCFPVNF